MVIRAMVNAGQTCFMSVRFGNVLGSSGSVVEIFQEQLASGGPLTVTHPEMTRFFMTTEEAVQLILQACSMSKGGEIFVLNMGTPMKVVDLARNFIILNGLEPEKDIPIQFVGTRPGEKLHEELFSPKEIQKDTGHPEIFMAIPEEANVSLFKEQLAELKELSGLVDNLPLLNKIKEVIPTFRNIPSESQRKVEHDAKNISL
jgi:FlaA1/EpsC-like NDP-sugar epimerase